MEKGKPVGWGGMGNLPREVVMHQGDIDLIPWGDLVRIVGVVVRCRGCPEAQHCDPLNSRAITLGSTVSSKLGTVALGP